MLFFMNKNLFLNSKAPGEGAYLNTNAVVSCETINNQKEGGTTLQKPENENDEFYNSIAERNDANVVGDIIAYIRNQEKVHENCISRLLLLLFQKSPDLTELSFAKLEKRTGLKIRISGEMFRQVHLAFYVLEKITDAEKKKQMSQLGITVIAPFEGIIDYPNFDTILDEYLESDSKSRDYTIDFLNKYKKPSVKSKGKRKGKVAITSDVIDVSDTPQTEEPKAENKIPSWLGIEPPTGISDGQTLPNPEDDKANNAPQEYAWFDIPGVSVDCKIDVTKRVDIAKRIVELLEIFQGIYTKDSPGYTTVASVIGKISKHATSDYYEYYVRKELK